MMSEAKIAERPLLLMLSMVQFTHLMDFMVMMPLGPQLMRLFHLEPQHFSLLVASYTFSAAVAGFLGALWVDRFDRKVALLFCYAGFLLGTLACALAPGFEALLAARVISGAFGGVAGAMVLTIIGDVVAPERRGRAIGVVMAAFSLASVAGVPLGLWLAARWNWHAPFFVIVALGALVWLAVCGLLPPMRDHLTGTKPKTFTGLRELLSSRNTVTALLFMMLMVFGHFVIIPFLSPSLVANAGMREADLWSFYLAGGVASLGSAPWLGRMSDKHGKLRVFCITVSLAMVPVYLLMNQGLSPLWSILMLAVAFFVLGGGRFVPGQAIITGAVPARLRGSFISLNNSVRDLAAGGASLLGGHIVVKDLATGKLLHLPTLGWIAIAASLLSVVLAARVKSVA